MNIQRELLHCTLFALVALGGAMLGCRFFSLQGHHELLLVLFLALTLTNYSLVVLGYRLLMKNNDKALAQLGMGITGFKLFLVAGLFGVYFKLNPEMPTLYVIPYLWIYLLFTIFEVRFLMYKPS